MNIESLNQPPGAPYLDTNTLMSSLREMIAAEVDTKLHREAGRSAEAEASALHYSLHETVVREQLLRLGAEASRYKLPVRYK